jgi:UDP-GlcNAc:undecaprenyl-phosphate GlcNAc-1-phosphate transferase
MHLHHRLLAIGHSHRRAVLIMYFWAALLSFGAVVLSIIGGRAELLVVIGVLLVVGVVVVLSPRARVAAREARAADLAAQRARSRAEHPTARRMRSSADRRASRGADESYRGASLRMSGRTDAAGADPVAR